MPKDLYKKMGVEKDASKKEINAAFKKLMVIHHPDKNGGKQSAEFDEIRRAYETLHNDESRRMYDEFGVIPGDDESTRKMQVISSLCQIFTNIAVQHSADQLERLDLIGTMRTQVNASMHSIVKQKKDMEKKLEDFKRTHSIMKKRLKHKIVGGDDFLMRAIEENIRQFPSNIINAEKNIALHKDMIEMLAEYEYEFDKVRSQSMVYGGGADMGNISTLMNILAGQI